MTANHAAWHFHAMGIQGKTWLMIHCKKVFASVDLPLLKSSITLRFHTALHFFTFLTFFPSHKTKNYLKCNV